MPPVENRIRTLLIDTFAPVHIDVLNESHMHSVPKGSESHFKVTLVSEAFVGKRQVQRHQAIYAALAGEFEQGLHALALHTFSPTEWQADINQVPDSPNCLGGSKHPQS